MSALIVDGKEMVKKLLPSLREEVSAVARLLQRNPLLGIFLVGPTESSKKFTDIKIKMAGEVGIEAKRIEYPDSIKENELRKDIAEKLQKDNRKHDGYIFQWPPPLSIGPRILNAIPDEVDVDRMARDAVDRFRQGRETVLPPIVRAFQKILEQEEFHERAPQIKGSRAVVVGYGGGDWVRLEGRENLQYRGWGMVGGEPVFTWLLQQGASVIPCHQYTKREDLEYYIRHADIVFSAVGKKEFSILGEWIREGAVVLDGGFSYDADGKGRGDITDYDAVKERAAVYAPSPGGIGRLTVFFVLKNLIELVKRQRHYRLMHKI